MVACWVLWVLLLPVRFNSVADANSVLCWLVWCWLVWCFVRYDCDLILLCLVWGLLVMLVLVLV